MPPSARWDLIKSGWLVSHMNKNWISYALTKGLQISVGWVSRLPTLIWTRLYVLTIEMNITGTLPSDTLPIFFLKPNLDPQTRVFIPWLTDWALFACVKRLELAFKFGFKFPVGGSVLVIFSSVVLTETEVCISRYTAKCLKNKKYDHCIKMIYQGKSEILYSGYNIQ
jgi:hypothetical protein